MDANVTQSDWSEVGQEVVAEIERKLRPVIQKLADELYDRLLFTAQDYLVDNALFNIGETIDSARRETQSRLNGVWSAVNVLGAPDSACTTDSERGYCQAIGDALAEIEKLGGRDPILSGAPAQAPKGVG